MADFLAGRMIEKHFTSRSVTSLAEKTPYKQKARSNSDNSEDKSTPREKIQTLESTSTILLNHQQAVVHRYKIQKAKETKKKHSIALP